MVAVTTRLIAVASVVVGVCFSFAAVQPRLDGDRTPAGQIDLTSGDKYSGRMVDSDQGGVVAWQTEFSDAPFLFPLDKLKSVSFSPPESPKPQPGEFCFELNGGQSIFGSLVAATDDSLVVESPRFGRLEIARDRVARFYRSAGRRGGLADGLQGLAGWSVDGLPDDWREEAGELVSEVPGASISQKIAVPRQFYVDIDAEWSADLGVEFEFGDVFRIETWKDFVIVAREPKTKTLVPAADTKSAEWRYTFEKPEGDWQSPDFDDSKWEVGRSGFGSAGEPHAATVWDTPDIWMRRTMDVPKSQARPNLHIRHDEGAEVYINGVLAAAVENFTGVYETERISDEAVAALKPTGNVIAIHCHQTGGGQYIDAGFVIGGGADGDFAGVRQPDVENGARLRCFVDLHTGVVKVTDFEGKVLATVEAPPNLPLEDISDEFLFRVTTYGSHVRIRQLVVSEWDGKETSIASADGLQVRLTDGQTITGEELSVGDGGEELVVAGDDTSRSIPLDDVASVSFGVRQYDSSQSYWLNLHDGSVLSGELTGVKRGMLHVKTSLADRELTIPVGDLRSLTNTAARLPQSSKADEIAEADSSKRPQQPKKDKSVLLEADGIVSHGALTESAATDSVLGLSWQPQDSVTASPVRRDARLRLVFREGDKESMQEAEDPRIAFARAQGLIVQEAPASEVDEEEKREPAPGLDGSKEYVVLVNGDRIDCHVKEFDETGLYIESELVTEEFIPADKVRVWETQQQTWLERMDEEKRRRLMTLPRKQREYPPTHMVESVTSDFLRTRLVKGDEENLYAQAQRKQRPIPRAAVQRVVWLPPTATAKKDSSKPAPDGKLPVTTVASRADDAYALLDDARQLSMKVEGLADGKLVGESSILGQCTIDVDSLAELRLGGISAEEVAASSLAKWRLHDAIDPIYMQDQELAENGRLTAGLNFPLVGKPAPDFNAPTLAGDPVKLSELRGHVVVLDFWASWCGPCIQAFPEIVALADSYDESKVRLVSVNLGENKETMQACLDRLQLSPTVAMDLDRMLAERYQVKSIPQTVVIDAQGNVARVFVGATPALPKQLRFAIDELLAPIAQ